MENCGTNDFLWGSIHCLPVLSMFLTSESRQACGSYKVLDPSLAKCFSLETTLLMTFRYRWRRQIPVLMRMTLQTKRIMSADTGGSPVSEAAVKQGQAQGLFSLHNLCAPQSVRAALYATHSDHSCQYCSHSARHSPSPAKAMNCSLLLLHLKVYFCQSKLQGRVSLCRADRPKRKTNTNTKRESGRFQSV